ncbi:MAG: fibrillarin-like rRNA/tRNA 2'-O-methyltransferase [Candidatus Hydrothermarchaeales archaeon]
MREIFNGIYLIDDKLATRNLVKGVKVYDEKLVQIDDVEYRSWNPQRSKLSAVILNGLKRLPIKRDSKVLYLGAASGTTASHISDIVEAGIVYCVEFSSRMVRELLEVCESRPNMVPLLVDARRPESYQSIVEKVDIIYQDVAQQNQSEILLKNARFYLIPEGHAIIAIKARSIDSTKDPEMIIKKELKKLKKGFKVKEVVDLRPYAKGHCLALLQSLKGLNNKH